MDQTNITQLRVVAVQMPAFSTSPKKEMLDVRGVGFKAMDAVTRSLGMTFTVNFIEGNTGMPLKNGSWTGVTGALQRNEADMTASCLYRTPARDEVLEFSTILCQSESYIYGGILPPESPDIGSIVRIFSGMVWFGIILSMIVLILVAGLEVTQERDKIQLRYVGRKEFYALISSYVAALFLEGTPRDPVSTRGRFLYGLWWLALLVLANGFCGHTRAMMMTRKESLRVSNLEHLVKLVDKIKPITIADSAFELFFKTGTTTDKNIFKRMMLSPRVEIMLSADNLELLSGGKAVVLYESVITGSTLGTKCAKTGLRNIYYSRDPFLSTFCYMPLRKGIDVTLRKSIDKRIRWLFEGHFIAKWLENENLNFQLCLVSDYDSDTEQALSLEDMKILFYLLVVCNVTCFMILTFEVVYKRMKRLL